jgi:hypothetical protein
MLILQIASPIAPIDTQPKYSLCILSCLGVFIRKYAAYPASPVNVSVPIIYIDIELIVDDVSFLVVIVLDVIIIVAVLWVVVKEDVLTLHCIQSFSRLSSILIVIVLDSTFKHTSDSVYETIICV